MSDGLLKLGRKPAAPPAGPVWLQSGFRPFFLLAGVVGALAVLSWLLLLRGVLVPAGALTGLDLHVHEMIFGFAAAVIAGFLLTAVKNWTGRAPAPPPVLAALVAVFLVGRLAVIAEAAGVMRGISALELLFMPALAIAVGRCIWQARDRRNAGVVGIVVALAAVDAVLHAAAWMGHGTMAAAARNVALLVPCVLLAVIGGRVIPMFTRNVVLDAGGSVRGPGAIDLAAVVATAGVAIVAAASAALPALRPVEAVVALLAGALTLLRMRGWASTATRTQPLLWILHVGHACLGLGLLLRGLALAAPTLLPVTVGTHVLAVGALSVLCLGMMTRVALGHSGRPLKLSRLAVGSYHSLLTALVLRVAAAWVPPLLDAAVLFFIIAFGLFVVAYLPVLLRPRADGAPG